MGTTPVGVSKRTRDRQVRTELAQELCESRGGRPGLPSLPNKPTVSVDVKQHSTTTYWSCVKVEVAVLGLPSLPNKPTVSVPDVKQHSTTTYRSCVKVEVAVLGSRPE